MRFLISNYYVNYCKDYNMEKNINDLYINYKFDKTDCYLFTLPIEIFNYILMYLNINNIIILSMSCPYLYKIFKNDHFWIPIAKNILYNNKRVRRISNPRNRTIKTFKKKYFKKILPDAINNNNYDVVKKCLKHSIMCNKRNNNIISNEEKNDMLIDASINGNLEMIKILLEYGANIHVKNNRPLYHACDKEHLDIITFLIKNGANIHLNNDRVLREACKHGKINSVKLLIEHGANIQAKECEAFRWSCSNGHYDIAEYFIKLKIDIHICDECAMRCACKYGHVEIVKLLLDNGANIYLSYKRPCGEWQNYVPLVLASMCGHIDIVKLLLKYDKNIEGINEALRKAFQKRHVNVVRILWENVGKLYVNKKYIEHYNIL